MKEPDKDSGVQEEEFKARTAGAATAKSSQEEVQKVDQGMNKELCIMCASDGKHMCKVNDKPRHFEQNNGATDLTVTGQKQH